MRQFFKPRWGEGLVEKPCVGRQEVGKPGRSRVRTLSSAALSLGGRLGLGAESGVLRSDSKEAVCPVLALVRDLANPDSLSSLLSQQMSKQKNPQYKEKCLVSKRNGTIYCQ